MMTMEMVNGKLEWVEVDIAEVVENIYNRAMFEVAVDAIPEIKPEPVPYRFHVAYPCEGKHEIDKAKIYDAEFAELHAEKAIRAEKFRKTHGKDKTNKERKADKIRRIRKLYAI